MRTDKCCCNCQKKIHSHLCLRILIHPTWHTTYPKTSFAIEKTRHPSMYRIFLPPGPARDATYSGPKSRKKKRRKGQKTMESQRLQQRSNSILNSYTIKILARASRGKAEERSEAQREPALVQIRRKKKKFFFFGSFFTFVHRWARQAVLIYLAVDRAHDSRAPFLRVSRPTPGALRPRHASGRRP